MCEGCRADLKKGVQPGNLASRRTLVKPFAVIILIMSQACMMLLLRQIILGKTINLSSFDVMVGTEGSYFKCSLQKKSF